MIYFHFTTRQFSTGAPITSASLAISVYKNDSTTESTSGVTTTFAGGFDGRAGLVSVKLDTSADGTFYAAGNDFSLVVTGGTADSVSIVGEAVKSFSIENRSALMPTTGGRKLDVSAGGEAGVDWANVGSPTTAQNLSGTNIATNQVVASVTGAVGSVTGAVGSVTGNVGGNVAGSVGSVTAGVTVTTNNDKTGYALSATGSAAMTESYAADGAAPTLGQFQYMIWSLLAERAISGTTLTAAKLDGTTAAMTFTLDNAVTPNAQTRAT